MTSQDVTSHLEIMAATERKGRTYWTRVGSAFPTQDGQGYRLKLDFVPTGSETSLMLLPPRPSQDSGEGQ